MGADEKQINQMQVNLDQMCSQIIARRQPTAIDLRFVLMITKIVNELERVGDEVKKIAYKAAQIRGADQPEPRASLRRRPRRGAARDMLQMSLDTFARLDATAAAEVIDRDEEIDAAFLAIMRQLISYMMEDPRTITAGARDRVHREVDRAHRRSREEHRGGGRPGGQGHRRPACVRRADPRRGGGGMSAAGPPQGARPGDGAQPRGKAPGRPRRARRVRAVRRGDAQ